MARTIVFPRACRKLNWASAARLFQEEGVNILAIWDSLPSEQLNERVLIRRFAGIEDSSRYWSAAMTVEHLSIVGTAIRQTLAGLRRGELPSRPARTQDVKPRGEIAPDLVRSEFVTLLADAASAETVELPLSPGEGPRFAHPWFGPIDGYQWHCLLGLHQGIHRKQIEAIRRGLGVS